MTMLHNVAKNSAVNKYKRIVFYIMLCLTFTGCQSASQMPVLWHQQYANVESAENLSIAHNAFEKAKEKYGKPFSPVREINIRYSKPNKEPSFLSRADITSQQVLAQKILSSKNTLTGGLIWSILSAPTKSLIAKNIGAPFSYQDQVAFIEDLNMIIDSDLFYKKNHANGEKINSEKNTSKTDRMAINRRFLEDFFQGLISPMPQRNKRALDGIELCEEIIPGDGRFVLYVSVDPSLANFYPQLFHETFHLLNNKLYDWYGEGLGYVFSREMAEAQGLSWQILEDHFQKGRDKDPYAIAYFMMQEVSDFAKDDMESFLNYAVWTDKSRERMHIDIDAWLTSLPEGRKNKIAETIKTYGKFLERRKGNKNYFLLPTNGPAQEN